MGILSASGATPIDFENSTKNGSREAIQKELDQLTEQLAEETGRGGNSIPDNDSVK